MNMKLKIICICSVLSFSACAQGDYKLVWQDEFDYAGKPDSTKWVYELFPPYTVNAELQQYTDDLRNVEVKDGLLYITARKDEDKITSGRILTRGKAAWLYGKIEARIKLPKGRGMWPAFWMMPEKRHYGKWPKCGEIDIMEFVGYMPDTVHATVHTGKYNHVIHTQKGEKTFCEGASDDYHVYACAWTPDKIEMSVDGRVYFEFKNDGSEDFETWPFNNPFHLILNVAVGGSWGGVKGVDESVFPQQMLVDYVRVYQEN